MEKKEQSPQVKPSVVGGSETTAIPRQLNRRERRALKYGHVMRQRVEEGGLIQRFRDAE